jgi:hypothetical protein
MEFDVTARDKDRSPVVRQFLINLVPASTSDNEPIATVRAEAIVSCSGGLRMVVSQPATGTAGRRRR